MLAALWWFLSDFGMAVPDGNGDSLKPMILREPVTRQEILAGSFCQVRFAGFGWYGFQRFSCLFLFLFFLSCFFPVSSLFLSLVYRCPCSAY